MRLNETYSAATVQALSAENGQLSRRMIWQTDWLWISDNEWSRDTHPDRHEVRATTCLEVMWEGAFLRRRGAARAVGDPHHVGFFNCDEGGTLDHPGQRRTRGTTFVPDPELLAPMIREASGQPPPDILNPFPWMSRAIASRTHVRLQEFRRLAARHEDLDPLALEEHAAALLEDVIREAAGAPVPRRPRPRTGRSRDRVLDAAARLAVEFRRPVRLADVAHRLGCNPTHASRLFREEMGIPVSRYVAALRVRHAARLILDGADNLAEVALECGFPSHSHLSTVFRREVGCAPSALRDAGARQRVTTILRTRSPADDLRRAK